MPLFTVTVTEPAAPVGKAGVFNVKKPVPYFATFKAPLLDWK